MLRIATRSHPRRITISRLRVSIAPQSLRNASHTTKLQRFLSPGRFSTAFVPTCAVLYSTTSSTRLDSASPAGTRYGFELPYFQKHVSKEIDRELANYTEPPKVENITHSFEVPLAGLLDNIGLSPPNVAIYSFRPTDRTVPTRIIMYVNRDMSTSSDDQQAHRMWCNFIHVLQGYLDVAVPHHDAEACIGLIETIGQGLRIGFNSQTRQMWMLRPDARSADMWKGAEEVPRVELGQPGRGHPLSVKMEGEIEMD